jgi:hypothetical protein
MIRPMSDHPSADHARNGEDKKARRQDDRIDVIPRVFDGHDGVAADLTYRVGDDFHVRFGQTREVTVRAQDVPAAEKVVGRDLLARAGSATLRSIRRLDSSVA